MTILKGREIALSAIFPNSKFFIVGVEPYYKYDSAINKRTDLIEGYRYELIESTKFTHIPLKVPNMAAVITADELDKRIEAGEQVFVTLKGAYLKMYYSPKTKNFEDSVFASSLHLCDDAEIELD